MSTNEKLAWGILGTGNIAKTFARALGNSRSGFLAAVGSRNEETAQKFAQEFGSPTPHGSYESLLADPQVQAVYISTPHPQHAPWAIACAEAGKHILCEKPLTLDYPQAMTVIEAAHRNDVFLMEAFMYRCHPQTAKLVELVREGAIGDVRLIDASFGFRGGFDPESRLFSNALGGGGILDVGCYGISMARLIAGAAQGKSLEPREVKAVGHVGETGVDEYSCAVLKFPNDVVAQISTGVRVILENTVRILGTQGTIFVPSPWFCGETEGKIKILVSRDGQETEEVIVEAGAGLYENEIDIVAAHIAQRQAPHPAMTWDDSLGNMRTLDLWRQAIGLVYDAEKPAAQTRPVSGKPLKVRPNGSMKFGTVAGIDKPVSRLVLGTMVEGSINRLTHGLALFDDFLERGGNCFDTALVYGSEPIVGHWINTRGVRDDIILIGKGAHTPFCTPEDLTRQLLESLDKLQTDHVDMYMMHRDNLDIPASEFIDVLNEHKQAGRMRAFGGSNWSVARVEEANAYAASRKLTGFAGVSNNFSLARMVSEVWDGCVSASDAASRAWLTQHQLPIFAWSSQARGFFSRGDRSFTADTELVRCWYSDDNFQRLERARELAKQKNTTPINIALAYVLCQPFPIFTLIGPQVLSETRTSFPGLDIELSPQELRWLNLED